MADPIRPNGVTPVGDDQQWKAEERRVIGELIARIAEHESAIAALQRRVN